MKNEQTTSQKSRLKTMISVLTTAFSAVCAAPSIAQSLPEDTPEGRHILHLTTLVDTPETRLNREWQDRINDYLNRSDNSRIGAMVILDPHRFNTGLALGLPDVAMVRALQKAHGMSIGGMERRVLDSMNKARIVTSSGLETNTHLPAAHHDTLYKDGQAQEKDFCLAVPASETLPFGVFEGLTSAQSKEMVLIHEAFHCIAMEELDFGHETDKKYQEILKRPPQQTDEERIRQDALLHALLTMNSMYRETFSDVGMVGEMIRAGKVGKDAAAKLAHQRSNWAETLYMSSPQVLMSLEREIDKMGLENFKKLSFDDSLALYARLTVKNALPLEKFADFHERDLLRRQKAATGDGHNHDHGINDVEIRDGKIWQKPDPALANKVKKWDARAELQAEISRLGQMPDASEALVRAYSALQTRLSNEERANPRDRLPVEKSIKLKEIYLGFRHLR